MLAFGFLFNIVERGRASYERVESLLSVSPTITDKKGAKEHVPSGAITYAIRQFSYPGTAHVVLKDISLVIEQGHTLGIVGRTGSGKTTLLRLLLREFDLKPEEGDIVIGGVSIQDVTLSALRSSIAYAPQDAFIFSQSVLDNIAFANPKASREDIVKAAYQAGVLEDIEQFPNGFETIIGERGTNLSGGQKQRISIARSLLQQAEILLLDDTLSAVDARTETHILDQIKNVRQGRTTIIATHRLRTVEHADQIIVLENGTIVEQGTHEYLWSLGGRYWDMYRRQQLETQVERGGVEV
jgi:ATP-binding cassette subfamily B protein